MRTQKIFTWLVLVTYVQIGVVPSTFALPSDGKVGAGNAVIGQPNAQTLHINQSTDKAIINWKGFSIDSHESVRFTQPNAGSIALNRVIGGDPSVILGQLLANGRVFLTNPNGILFGAGAVVNTAGLLATTFNIKDSDLMAGHASFTQDPAKALSYVINKGQIHVSENGFVLLVAPAVSNEGLIVANLGKVALGAGDRLSVDFMGDGLVTYVVDGKVLQHVTGPDGKSLASAVNNSGSIQADGGQILLTARAASDVFASVINQSGLLQARSLVNHGGVIRLEGSDPVANTGSPGWQHNLGKVQHAEGRVLNSGTLDVSAAESGAAQGQVTISGEKIGIAGTILAKGAADAQGGRVLITSSGKTSVTNDTLIETSGAGNSSAGNVVIWSDKDTTFGGTIVARGGQLGGNGGQLEVSGHQNLNFFGRVDTLAPNGKIGSLLLDPLNITIATGGAGTLAQVDQFSDTPATNRTIAPATINGALANVVLQANNDITVTNAIAMTNAGVGITMQAGRDINVNAGIATTNGHISLTANDSGAVAANRSAGTGDIVFGAAGHLNAGGGNITLTVGSSAAAPFSPGSITTVRNLTTTTGNITINSPNTVSLSGALNAGSGTTTIHANTDGAGAQSFTMNAGSSIATSSTAADAVEINVNAAAGGTGTAALRDITTGNGGGITVRTNTGGNSTGGDIIQSAGTLLNVGSGRVTLSTSGAAGVNIGTAGANILVRAGTFSGTSGSSGIFVTNNQLVPGTSVDLASIDTTGSFTFATNGSITGSGALSVGGTATLTAGAGNDITLTNGSNNFGTVSIVSGSDVVLTDNNALVLGASTISGSFDVTAGGALTQSGALAVGGATTIAAGSANNITLNHAANNFSAVSVASGNNVTLRDANALVLGPSAISGTLNVTTAGGLTQSGALSVAGTTTLAAGAANDITLNSAANNLGTVQITSGRNVTIQDGGALNFGASTISSTLNVTTNGAITDSGNVVVAGNAMLAAGAGSDITLDSTGNNFSTVGVLSGRNVTLRDANALTLGASTISGALNLTTAGAVTQSGALTVGGATTIAAGSANNITLNHAANDFASVGIASANNVTLRDANALTLAGSTVSGALNVTSGDALTQSGALTVAGTTTLAAAGNITLDHASNNFSTVGIVSANDVTLRDTNALNVGASTISGTLSVTTGAAVTDSGNVVVAGNTMLTAGAGSDITLDSAGNDFNTVGVTNGRNVMLRDVNDVGLGAVNVAGSVSVIAAGAIMDANGVANNISATQANLTGSGIGSAGDAIETTVGMLDAVTSTGGIFINQTGNLVLNNVVAGGEVAVSTAVGDLTVGTVTANAGGVTLTAQAGSIVDGNGSATNVTASGPSGLHALGGVVGSVTDPVEVNIAAGGLGVTATGQLGGISVAIDGAVAPGNTLTLLPGIPGTVFFNGISLTDLPVAAAVSPLIAAPADSAGTVDSHLAATLLRNSIPYCGEHFGACYQDGRGNRDIPLKQDRPVIMSLDLRNTLKKEDRLGQVRSSSEQDARLRASVSRIEIPVNRNFDKIAPASVQQKGRKGSRMHGPAVASR